jgi:DNA-binding transcriptional regulator YhcF (GntR family)
LVYNDRVAPHRSVVVDRSSEEPVYAQIARQIRARIASGDLGTGVALPSVRTLAGDLGVNLNTVARAYRELEDDGFVEIRDRTGARVAPPGAPAVSRDALRDRLRDVVARLRQAGVSPREIERLAAAEIAALETDPGLGRQGQP